MSKKRTKQYLMLLMVIGLVSIAAGNSGTFASFNAEVTNAGNTFATGSLFLHDTTGGTTCTSESASSNLNDGTNGDTCHTIFNFTDNGHAQYANLTLANAGSIDASGIKFALGQACSTAKVYETNTTLASDATAGDTHITVTTPMTLAIPPGGWIQLTDGNTTEEVQVDNTSYGLNPASGTINLASPLAHSYTAADPTTVESSPQFAGGGDLCSALDFNITETDSGLNPTEGDTGTSGVHALGCAYGSLSGTGCSFDNSHTLTAVGTSLNPLTLAVTPFAAGESRYLVLGLKPDSSLGNEFQDENVKVDLVWHIDQA